MIRPLALADLPRVLDLWEQLMADGERADPRYRVAADARRVFTPYASEVWTRVHPFPATWVADEGGLQGFLGILPQFPLAVLAVPPTALITDVFVVPGARGRGLARRMVMTAVESAAQAGYSRVEVGTLSADVRASGFWQAMGFGAWRTTLVRSGGAAS